MIFFRKYIGVGLIAILTFFVVKQQKQMHQNAKSMSIFGVVSKVEYTIQRKAIFIINGRKYDSYEFIWDYNKGYIHVGDTVIKRKGSLILQVKKGHK
jgi:hypothetical protein